uniref:Glycosyltransferase 61 catalytic domain-containing protein n=1 Tax=Chromera velia CCMP2878 TaxID=1169474 RepID=A0A0G4HNI6_9ALVE|eukprot:Cvel_7613.t1-p1 / transcript=Cvel_7613.t1 / gene=Cvel_7613 / organism=Chromera_velia_CCMP2878 / gene_product=hypothetical protein / transcript_product=hypothetical protein / location=Cvel_scaffold401:79375-80568(+) / protein_length=398 / sequence_SO=supercontig / SO=protein_coding / is_pseudo=false
MQWADGNIGPVDDFLVPRVVRGPFPKRKVPFDGENLVVARRFSLSNPGHALDEMGFALFTLMYTWLEKIGVRVDEGTVYEKMRDARFQLFLNDTCVDEGYNEKGVFFSNASPEDLNIAAYTSYGLKRLCEKFTSKIIAPLFDSYFERKNARETFPSGTACFANVFAGISQLNIYQYPYLHEHALGPDEDIRAKRLYRAYTYYQHGKALPYIRGPHILLLKKVGKQNFSNYPEIEAYLRSNWTEAEACGWPVKVSTLDPATVSVADQLDILSTTSVMIAPAGAVAIASFFLPDGAAVISGQLCSLLPSGVPPNEVQPHQLLPEAFCHNHEIKLLYRRHTYVHWMVYQTPVFPEDMTPSQSDSGKDNDRRWMDYRVKIDVLHPYVHAAMRRWVDTCDVAV